MTIGFNRSGESNLGYLLTEEVIEQFQSAVADARWVSRVNAGGSSLVVDPTTHGLVTGSVCDYFSNSHLLSFVGQHLETDLHHFVGNIAKMPAQTPFQWSGGHFPAAMVVNLGHGVIAPWNLHAGEATLLNTSSRFCHRLPPQKEELTLVEGYFV